MVQQTRTAKEARALVTSARMRLDDLERRTAVVRGFIAEARQQLVANKDRWVELGPEAVEDFSRHIANVRAALATLEDASWQMFAASWRSAQG